MLLQASVDRSAIPGIVNTQLVNPWAANDAAAKASFPGISVTDEDRADVRPPNPAMCVGDNYVMEVSAMVRAGASHCQLSTRRGPAARVLHVTSAAAWPASRQLLGWTVLRMC